jgi:hypothetical protein
MSYNSFLGLTNETNPNSAGTTIGYDAMARPNSTTSPFGATTTNTYNDTASLKSIRSNRARCVLEGKHFDTDRQNWIVSRIRRHAGPWRQTRVLTKSLRPSAREAWAKCIVLASADIPRSTRLICENRMAEGIK